MTVAVAAVAATFAYRQWDASQKQANAALVPLINEKISKLSKLTHVCFEFQYESILLVNAIKFLLATANSDLTSIPDLIEKSKSCIEQRNKWRDRLHDAISFSNDLQMEDDLANICMGIHNTEILEPFVKLDEVLRLAERGSRPPSSDCVVVMSQLKRPDWIDIVREAETRAFELQKIYEELSKLLSYARNRRKVLTAI